jgi:hypothetical protein
VWPCRIPIDAINRQRHWANLSAKAEGNPNSGGSERSLEIDREGMKEETLSIWNAALITAAGDR